MLIGGIEFINLGNYINVTDTLWKKHKRKKTETNVYRMNEWLIWFIFSSDWASLVAQTVKNLSAMQETEVRSLGQEDPLEKGMATHSRILAWRIPWTEDLVGYSPWGHKKSDMTEQLTHSSDYGYRESSRSVYYFFFNNHCHTDTYSPMAPSQKSILAQLLRTAKSFDPSPWSQIGLKTDIQSKLDQSYSFPRGLKT